MTIQVKELVLRDFTHAQIDLYNNKGDFSDLSGLFPSRITPGRLQRAPAWTAHKAFPAGFTACEAMFYNANNDNVVFVGIDAGSDLATCFASVSSWTIGSLTDISGATGLAGLGGLRGRNVLWFEDNLYLIGDDATLYQGTSYIATVTQFDASSFACLATYGDRFYGAKTDGSIERLDDAGTAMEAHWTAHNYNMRILFLTGYRGYLYAIARNTIGTRLVVQIDSAEATTPSFQVMAEVHDVGIEGTKGCHYAQFGNYLYFMAGVHTSLIPGIGGSTTAPAYAPIYRYRFSSAGDIELVATIECEPSDYFYLLPWNGYLLLARLTESATAALVFYNIHDDGGISRAIPLTADTSGIEVVPFSSHGFLAITAETGGTTQGIYQIGPETGFQDGYLVTSRLDMGYLGKAKRLDQITVHLDNEETNFKVIISYRTDENTTWTPAVTGNALRLVTIADLGVEFHTIQLRIDLDDDSTNDADYRINAVSLIYTIDI